MHKKELVIRTKQGKQHLYRAALERKNVESSLLNRLSDSVFGGSPVRLALSALGQEKPNPAELEELQRWLDQQKND
jgi:predicted transcriptional regulator